MSTSIITAASPKVLSGKKTLEECLKARGGATLNFGTPTRKGFARPRAGWMQTKSRLQRQTKPLTKLPCKTCSHRWGSPLLTLISQGLNRKVKLDQLLQPAAALPGASSTPRSGKAVAAKQSVRGRGSMRVQIRPYQDSDESAVIALWSQVLPDSAPHNDPATAIRKKLAVQRDLFFV